VISFLALGKIFTAFTTGNIAFLGMGIAGRPGAPRIVSVLASMAGFAGGVYLATMFVKRASQSAAHAGEQATGVVWPRQTTFALGISLLPHLCFLVIWVATGGEPDDNLIPVLLAVWALAMGNQSAAAKRLEPLRELVPGAARVAVIVNPADAYTETMLRDAEPATRAIGWQIQVLEAATSRAIDAAFATFVRERPDALFVGSSPFFTSRRVQLVQLAARHAVPAIYPGRQYAEHGGLMSYGGNLTDAWRQLGLYTGRVLKGAKPADLPVVQASKFELVINHQTARMLGLTVPPSLLAIADEVIE